ncbi:hypothetical protein ACQZ61_04220 [Agrobacterium vitis]|uniref:hypothetical protein n=1 Tax=Agrobacterium vitis TaxID=373 RepID=UPI001F29442F|nr:hypothetical protein [Agrobacterium vitis]MCF1452269.1 hypothetical protein [Agrobacterium vitis]
MAGLMLSLGAPGANAASSDMCKLLAEPLTQAATGVRQFAEATKTVNMTTAIRQFTGAEREALIALQKKNSEALHILEAYAAQLEDTAYVMKKCAR